MTSIRTIGLILVAAAPIADAAYLRSKDPASDYAAMKQMPVQSCDSYPGTMLSNPVECEGDDIDSNKCACIADPGVHTSEKAWSCPKDMVLKYDDVADKTSGSIVPQWHCTKQKTDKIKTSEPLQCQPGWTAEVIDGKGACSITRTECDENDPTVILYDSTEFGIMSAPKDCYCKKTIVVDCIDDATFNAKELSCEWEIDVTSTVITRPLSNYVLSTDGALEHLTITKELALPEMNEDPPIAADDGKGGEKSASDIKAALDSLSLSHEDWKITYRVPVLCPIVIPIPENMLVCGPKAPEAIVRTLRTFVATDSLRPIIQPKPKPVSAFTDTWTECNNQCALIIARSTECAYHESYMCEITSATPNIDKKAKTYYEKQVSNMKSLQTFITSPGNSNMCLGNVGLVAGLPGQKEDPDDRSGDVYQFMFGLLDDTKFPMKDKKDKSMGAKDVLDRSKFSKGISQVQYKSAEMGTHRKLMDLLGAFEVGISSIVDASPKMHLTPCLPYYDGTKYTMRRDDGSCLKNHKRHINWERTKQQHRQAAESGYNNDLAGIKKSKEGLAVTNPFAVDCRAYASGVYKHESEGALLAGLKDSKTQYSFLGCKRACDEKDLKKTKKTVESKVIDSFDASVFPEYFCGCGEVFVSKLNKKGKEEGTCIAPDPELHVSPPGYFGTTKGLEVVRKDAFKKFERREKVKDNKIQKAKLEKEEAEEKKALKEAAEKAEKEKKKSQKKKAPKKKKQKKQK
jgi:hypothetical protein